MKNFIKNATGPISLVAPYDVSSGDGFLVGTIFAVAAHTAVSGAAVEGLPMGEFDLKKTSAQAWATVGLALYWDNTAKEVTTVSTSNGNPIGHNTLVAANPSATGRVRVIGIVR
jgi:predicted RecA/RadA family phage recombinase